MGAYFSFLEEYHLFLTQWHLHINSIFFAGFVWIAIVIHLVITHHASFGSNGESDDIGCGDTRVWRILVIFGGPSGISFGLGYYWLMQILGLTGFVREYWIGFIYVQFVSSAIQTFVFFLYCLLGPRSVNPSRFFKAHLKGCGWVSGLSPVGWIFYLIQQFLPNEVKFITLLPRDLETLLLFVFNLIATPLVVICLAGSVLNQRWIIPMITWIDEDHKEDEDSSVS